MSFIDILLACLLAFAIYQGLKNGLFVELASFVSIIVGIYLAIKWANIVRDVLKDFVSWSPQTIQISAFVITFILVVVGVILLAKFFTSIADFAHLGSINKLGGAFFRVLKVVLIVSICLNLLDKLTPAIPSLKQTFDDSYFCRPIQKVGNYVYPSIKRGYEQLRKKQ